MVRGLARAHMLPAGVHLVGHGIPRQCGGVTACTWGRRSSSRHGPDRSRSDHACVLTARRSASNLGPAAAGTPTSPRNSYSHVPGNPQPHHGSPGPGPGAPPLPPLPPGQHPTHSHNTPTVSHQPHTSPPNSHGKGAPTVHDSSAQEDLLSLTASESRRLSITAGSSKRLAALNPAPGAGPFPHNSHSPAPNHHPGGSSSAGTTPPAPVSSAARATMSAVPSEVLDSYASDGTDAASASRKANGSNDSIISNADISMQASGRKPAGWRRERPAPLQVSGSGSGLGQVQASPPGLAAMQQQHRLASIRRSQTHDLEPGGAVMTSANAWHGAGGEVVELEEGQEDSEARRTPEREHEEVEDVEEGDARESPEVGEGYGHSSTHTTLGRRKTPADVSGLMGSGRALSCGASRTGRRVAIDLRSSCPCHHCLCKHSLAPPATIRMRLTPHYGTHPHSPLSACSAACAATPPAASTRPPCSPASWASRAAARLWTAPPYR